MDVSYAHRLDEYQLHSVSITFTHLSLHELKELYDQVQNRSLPRTTLLAQLVPGEEGEVNWTISTGNEDVASRYLLIAVATVCIIAYESSDNLPKCIGSTLHGRFSACLASQGLSSNAVDHPWSSIDRSMDS